ncbi:MAG TPA: hypothetical protein VKY37_03930 [Brumimicrobium sp.]|nr:hypothetical protein [Brumimicrobium sp.]
MIEEQTAVDEFTETSNQKRPKLLNVLLFLSGVYIAGNFLGVVNSLIGGPLSEEQLEAELSNLYTSAADLQATGAGEQFGRIIETMIDNAIYINNEAFMATNLSTLLTLVIGALSVFLMFKLKKVGFHLYIAYSLLPIITMYMITPMELILTFSVVTTVVIGSIFSILYGMNLKYMK